MGIKKGSVLSTLMTLIMLVASLLVVVGWVVLYRHGYGWQSNPTNELNWHLTLMIAGFTFCSGLSMISYRLMPRGLMMYVKLIHTTLHVCAIMCIVFGFQISPISSDSEGFKMSIFDSLHSWLGLATMALLLIQFLMGFFVFLICFICNETTSACRKAFVATHSFFGIITFILATATTLTGMAPKSILKHERTFSMPLGIEEATFINIVSFVIVLTTISLMYTLITPYIRHTRK